MTVTGEPGPHPLLVEPEEYLGALTVALTEPGTDRAARVRDDLLIPLAASDLAAVEVGTSWRVIAAIRALWSRVEPPADLEPAWAALAEGSRSGSPEEIGELAAEIARIGADVWLTSIEAVVGGGVELGYHATLRQDLLTAANADHPRAWIVIKHRQRGTERRISAGDLAQMVEGGALVWSGRAVLDAETAADGAPLDPGIWDAYVRVEALGLSRDVRLGSRRLEPCGGLAALPVTVRPDGRIDQLYFTARDQLSLTVRATPQWLVAGLADGRIDVTADGLRYRTGVRWVTAPPTVRLDLEPVGPGRLSRWRLVPAGPGWLARPGRGRLRLAPGRYRGRIQLTPPGGPDELLDPIELSGLVVIDRSAQRRWWRATLRRAVLTIARRRRQR